jgi:DnaJ-like protein
MILVIFDRIAELKIREGIADGKFDNLPNAGQPLDLEDYFQTPAEWRLAYSILKSAKCLPEEVELLNEIASLERSNAEAVDAQGARRRRLRDLRLRLGVLLDRKRRSR